MVKPTNTEVEARFANCPMRASPSASWNTPTMNASTMAAEMNCGDPGSKTPDRLLNTSAEIAAVGPDTICQEEPNTAATIGGSSAAKKPYSGGRPAMAANATP